MRRTTVNEHNKKWMKSPSYRREYAALEEEFSLSAALIEARSRAGLRREAVSELFSNHAKRASSTPNRTTYKRQINSSRS